MSSPTLTPSGRLPKQRPQSPPSSEKSRYRRPSGRLREQSTETKEQVLSASQLVRQGVMKLIWMNEETDFRIGFMKHSPQLKQALANGDLEVFLKALTESYREVYGFQPWEEYLCCSNEGCTGKRSITDVFGENSEQQQLGQLEQSLYLDPSQYECPVDKAPMEFFYDPEDHLDALRNAFQEEVFATLLFKGDHRLMGFCLGFETTVEQGWNDKVIAGKGDETHPQLPFADYLEEALRLFGEGTQLDDKVINIAEWGTRKETQRQGLALRLMRSLYQKALENMRQTEDGDVPVFAHTLENSRAYKVTNQMGFQWGKVLPSGKVRAYLTLKKALEGIDRMMVRGQVKRLPVHKAECAEKEIPRDTLVIEMLMDEAVGTDEAGNEAVHRYLNELANLLGLKPMTTSVTHLSPKYGLSGWLPLQDGSAIHLYAWDHHDTADKPFISIDVSTTGTIVNPEVVREHAQKFFQGQEPITTKHMQHHENPHWQELAPQILRQRISISGRTKRPLQGEDIEGYLKDLAPALNMVQLSEPLIVGNAAWIHWETSGVVLHWTDRDLHVDIYTCKAFDPNQALAFTSSRLGLEQVHHKNF